MCKNDVRATSVIYNPVWKHKSFQIEYNFQFIFFQLPTDSSSGSRIFLHGMGTIWVLVNITS